jgi:hypothetical protein
MAAVVVRQALPGTSRRGQPAPDVHPASLARISFRPSTIVRLFSTKRMPPLHLLCDHSEATAALEGCFESILARSWYQAGCPLPNAGPCERLEWISVILSDNNRVHAAAFYAAYAHCCSQTMDDQAAVEALQLQYYKLQCSVTPIRRLPVEILTKIFVIALGFGEPRTGLMQVCQHWRRNIEGISSAWTSLELGSWSAPERVQQSLLRAGVLPLTVGIDIGKTGGTVEDLYSALAIAATHAPQWETLIIASLPQFEQEDQSIDKLLSMHLHMNQLKVLKIMQPVSSPLLSPLLEIIATTVAESLASMEIHSPPAIMKLLQPTHVSIFRSLTTFKAHLRTMSHSIDLLPHFNQLKVLELTSMHLPIYDSHPLPLVQTLQCLHLRAVSIQWMGGHVFPKLEQCIITTPPITNNPLVLDVTLPACTALHIVNKDLLLIRRFKVPIVRSLVVKSNQWSRTRGDEQITHLFRVVHEASLQPHTLHLAISCQDKVLLAVLQLLPGLKELRLDLGMPSALGNLFFTALLAKPIGQVDRSQFNKLKWGQGWEAMICPSLKVLELRYQRWLRQTDSLDFLILLFAISWSRERTATPLELELHFKPSSDAWKALELSSQSIMEISTLAIPSLMYSDQSFPIDLHENCFTIATQDFMETKTWERSIYESLCFPFCFNHLHALYLAAECTQKLNVLPLFQQLEDLFLFNIQVTPPTLDVDLPLVHTLRGLYLERSTLSWMDGRVFAKLETFEVDEDGWPGSFKHNVQMPVCTYIRFKQNRLKVLPLLHSSFYIPLLSMWQLCSHLGDFKYDDEGIIALQSIQVKTIGFGIGQHYHRLLDFLEAKDEVEKLELTLYSPFDPQGLLTRLSVINGHSKKVPCSNMKVLGLKFRHLEEDKREPVSKWCEQMMYERRLAGHPIRKCHIWWEKSGWGKRASLVLVMQNEEVRIEE